MIRAVVFDLYDTLIWRDEAITARARAQIAEILGVPLSELNRSSCLHRDERMLGKVATIEGLYALVAGEAGRSVAPEAIAEAARLERASLAESVGTYANSVAVLRELRDLGFRLGLLSNASDTAALPLTHLRLEPLFDALILSHLEGVLKPDHRIYHIACHKLGVAAGECAYVADGGFGELDAAHEVGMLAVKIEQERQSSDYGSSKYHDLLVRDVAELLPLARAWWGAVR